MQERTEKASCTCDEKWIGDRRWWFGTGSGILLSVYVKVPLHSFKNIRTCIATLYFFFFFFNLVQFSNSDIFQWWNQRWAELHNLNDHYISTKWYSFKVDKPIIWWMDVILNCSSQLQVGRWLEGTRTNFRPMFLLFLLKTPEKRGYKKETLAWNDLIN